ncbi:MAG: hypothetical protein C5B48_10460 [Candidatus Rokuibacteriota bacterium]|nr:MAG: hypothetical protein C5B48_10460 [Candidatus Rokubacteria bacterium]
MRARLLVPVFGAATFLLAASVGSAAGSGVHMTPLASISFPDRAFVLTTPKPIALNRGLVRVQENGQAVDGLSVIPARAARARIFGAVLVIDASNSMQGASIAEAMKAARVFAANKAANAALGVVTFNKTATVAVPPTSDAQAVATSLQSLPTLARGTHLYDATARAIDVLSSAKIKAGSIVVLSDGRDTGSALSGSDLAARAKAAGVRIFTVGLRSYQFTPQALRNLARATGGSYAEAASASSLSGIYKTRSKQLASEYLLRYRSLAGPAEKVHVKVFVAGLPGATTTSYETPALPTTLTPPFHRSFADRFLASPLSVLLMSLLAAGLVWFAVSALLRHRRSTLRGRIGDYAAVSTAGGQTQEEQLRSRERLLSHVLLTAERAFQRAPWWDRFEEELEIAEYPIGPVPLAAGTIVGTVVAAVALALISPLLALGAIAVPFVVRSHYKRKLAKKRKAFETQLPDNLTVLAASLRAGHSFVGALSSVLEEAEEPSRSELRRAVSDEQLGVPIEEALLRVARRMDSADLEQVALVASLQRETGGNTAEVLDAVVDSVRERFELRRLVSALTAQGRLARWILTLLPIITGIIVGLLNPGYLRPLFTTPSGQFLLGLAVVLVIIGSFAIKRITEIEI